MTDQSEKKESLPIYQRLAAQLREQIKYGVLPPGSKLPSIRNAANEFAVSVGTVRHVYSLLEREGLITVDQGRGTFVSCPENKSDSSRKQNALDSIDEMLDTLADNGFSTQQAQTFFELRLRQRESMTRPVRIVAVAKSPEERSILGNYLEMIAMAEVYRMSFDDLISSPERIAYGPDFLCHPVELENELEELDLPDVKRMPLSIVMTEGSILRLSHLIDNKRKNIGVLAVSRSFLSFMHAYLRKLFADRLTYDSLILGNSEKTAKFIADKDILLLPSSFNDFVDVEEVGILRQANANKQKQLWLEFACDEGSMIYINRAVQERYRELRADISNGG